MASSDTRPSTLGPVLAQTADALRRVVSVFEPALRPEKVGYLESFGRGTARVSGLGDVASEEVLRMPDGSLGWVMSIDEHEAGVVLLDAASSCAAGQMVRRTGEVSRVPVGEDVLGRVLDPLGRPRDGKGLPRLKHRRGADEMAPAIMARAPVSTPLLTGLKVVDALIPIGRGQRELIVGDRQTGKTAVAVDTILNQRAHGVLCVYCAIGQRASGVARVVADLRERGGLAYTAVVVAEADAPPGLQYLAPYAATAMAEYFMRQGNDVLIVYDDLTQHARAYRELSLLLRRPPGREAFPGDIFYLHSRLLERATRLRPEHGGGSLTALPIVETEAQNIAGYIPTNIISITDGQIVLSPQLVQRGLMPAVDVGLSVSRVGGKAQLPAYRAVTADLRLLYAQFEELELFSRFASRLDEQTQRTLKRGRRVRSVLSQRQYEPTPAAEQISVLYAASRGLFDDVPEPQMPVAEQAVRESIKSSPELAERIRSGSKLTASDLQTLLDTANRALAALIPAQAADESTR